MMVIVQLLFLPVLLSFYPISPFPTYLFCWIFYESHIFSSSFFAAKRTLLPRVKWLRNSKYFSFIFLILKNSFSELLRPYSVWICKRKLIKIIFFAQFLSDLSFQLFLLNFLWISHFFFLQQRELCSRQVGWLRSGHSAAIKSWTQWPKCQWGSDRDAPFYGPWSDPTTRLWQSRGHVVHGGPHAHLALRNHAVLR